ncbi:hypothetical protein MVEN_00640400 [Mycena venus]|uniref:F-box domain-containing protein n=1 Tax=Mycena venus TaxID=2733690 RepID=A0A8H6YKJ1_9AGAR|nr:hypothetical protein MVEN_00640400 [Mycena venus]
MAFSLISRSLARIRPKRLLPNSPRALPLPVELWDIVLDLLTNDDLLQTGCVCRAWNELSLTIYMRRHNVTASTTSINIPSFFLQALHIACAVPQIDTLRCTFPCYGVLRRMRSLRAVVSKCSHLTTLSIDWGHDPFKAHYGVKCSPEVLVAIFRNILRIMAKRTHGPVIVVANETILRFEVDDIPRWPLITRAAPAMYHGVGPVLLQSTKAESFYLNRLEEVTVRSIRDGSDPLERFTLITFPTTSLNLRPTEKLTVADLSAILPHITLPWLYSLYIKTNAIDPVALSEFRDRHTRLRDVESASP